jgi:hypothetical protein
MDPKNIPTPNDNASAPTEPNASLETPVNVPGSSVTPTSPNTPVSPADATDASASEPPQHPTENPAASPEVEVELNNDVSQLGNSTLGSDATAPSERPAVDEPTPTPSSDFSDATEQEAIAEGAPAVNDQVSMSSEPASTAQPGASFGQQSQAPMPGAQPSVTPGAPAPIPDGGGGLPDAPRHGNGPLIALVVVVILAAAAAAALYFIKK